MNAFLVAMGLFTSVAVVEVGAEVIAELASDSLLATVEDWFLYGGRPPDPEILSEADRLMLEQLSAVE